MDPICCDPLRVTNAGLERLSIEVNKCAISTKVCRVLDVASAPRTLMYTRVRIKGDGQHADAVDESLEQGSQPGKTQERKVYIPGGEEYLKDNRGEPEK